MAELINTCFGMSTQTVPNHAFFLDYPEFGDVLGYFIKASFFPESYQQHKQNFTYRATVIVQKYGNTYINTTAHTTDCTFAIKIYLLISYLRK